MPGELEIIARLRARARRSEGVRVGIGDDAAVLQTGGERDLLACSDLMAEGVHFRREWSPPRLLGRKALAVTLSDIAAMGGAARYAMVSIALPQSLSPAFIEALFDGLFDYAEESGVAVIGGDTSSSRDSLFIDTMALGDCEAGQDIRRSGARGGDLIYVTGGLGAALAGLLLLERGHRLLDGGAAAEDEMSRARTAAMLKHLSPAPRLVLGRTIGERGLATAMIDVSDGLSTDLAHIADESGCGAIVRAAALPIAEAARWLAGELKQEPLSLVLHGGEEYELLFTARPEDHARVVELSNELAVPITAIGEITASGGLRLERDGALETLHPSGYEHHI
ncbi:MAG TPA: thiamine-phosphate kinase [Blastocatellia bacterium]|nr:thiamine-phosphate kinase [Blastocatellia bacterium]